jgi:dimethylargininase
MAEPDSTPRNLTALVRRPAPSLATSCELTWLSRSPIHFTRIEAQHAAYCVALRRMGLDVLVLDALPECPDSVFVEDVALVLDELVVMTRPGATSRRAEPRALEPALARLRPRLLRIEAPGTLDGGDVLRIGRRCFVGRSERSNPAGIAQLHDALEALGYEVNDVAVRGSLHLKTACTALDDATLLVNPAWVDTAAFAGMACIEVDPDEPFAANILRVGRQLLVNAAFPATLHRVQRHAGPAGISLSTVDISEFGKAEAGLTCLSIVFDA